MLTNVTISAELAKVLEAVSMLSTYYSSSIKGGMSLHIEAPEFLQSVNGNPSSLITSPVEL